MSSATTHAPAIATSVGSSRRLVAEGATAHVTVEGLRNIKRRAAVAQLVERELPKLEVTGSRPARRSLHLRRKGKHFGARANPAALAGRGGGGGRRSARHEALRAD